MCRLFGRYPEALARTAEIMDRCRFSLSELAYQYPEERDDPTLTPQQTLEKLLPRGTTGQRASHSRARAATDGETAIRPYFLTVNSIVRFARSKDIPYARGADQRPTAPFAMCSASLPSTPAVTTCCSSASLAKSAGSRQISTSISSMNGARSSCSGSSTPIDHAALCSTVIRYRAKGALQDAGKALGLTEDLIKTLSSQVWGLSEEGVEPRHVEELNLSPTGACAWRSISPASSWARRATSASIRAAWS
jgi:error-prone DNA polymerase